MLYIRQSNIYAGKADDMDRISVLLQKYKKVWFYVPENTKDAFCKEVGALGGSFSDGDALTTDYCGQFMSVAEDGTVSYVSAMAWMAAKEPGNGHVGIHHSFDSILKIIYEESE